MSKLTFKRIALVVVATLGLGLFTSGPSQSAITPSSDTLTLSATSSTIAAGETASVTVTQTGIGNAGSDSLLVWVTNQSSPASGNGSLGFYVTDSSNAAIRTTANTATGPAAAADFQQDYYGFTNGVGTALGTNIFAAASPISSSLGVAPSTATAFSATYSLRFMAPTVAGTYVFRLYAETSTVIAQSAYTPVSAPLTWTVTVTANASDVATTASKFWLNGLAEYTAFSRGATVTTNTYKGLEADSALVVSAGALGSYGAAGVISPVMMNSSDTKISTRTGGRVLESMTVTISGPGQLQVHSRYAGLGTTYSKQVTMAYDETAVVYSDGVAGTGTMTAYVGSASTSNKAVTQGTKTIAFVGRATTFTVTGYSAAIRAGSAVKYAGAADSATAAATAFRFVAADAAGNAVTAATLSTDKGEGAFYAISSDTAVLAAGEAGATYSASASRRSPALSCTYDSTSSVKGYWYCTGRVFDSGTVTVTIVDSRDVTASGSNYLTTTTGAIYKSTAFSITYAGDANTGTIAFDKTTYDVNSAATLTLTAKDGAGRTVADGSYTGLFSSLSWKSGSPTFGENTSANAAGGSFTNLVTYLGTTGPSFVGGTDTALVYMPTVAGTYTLVGKTGIETTTKDLLTITVVDPAQSAIKAAADAATASADAATDAAAEAIDAANAATDAANLAAEAADAATVAAEEARDAADAATAAVEELATQVATLMAALKAQITTLANTVAKIAKKVKA